MGQTVRIKVTQWHIDEGQRNKTGAGRCYGCPIALAFHDAGFPAAYVTGPSVHLNGRSDERIRLPIEAQKFAMRADVFGRLSPIEFDFTVPEENHNAANA